jgi:hypothetical protein
MTAANTVNTANILKDIWHDSLESTYYKEAPLLAMTPKDTSWSGNAYDVVVNYGPVAGRSSDFNTALALRAPSKFARMVITSNDNYVIWSVDHKQIQLSRNDAGAVERILTGELERATKKFKRSMCWMIYGDGGGAIGRISTVTAPSTVTVTLNDRRTIRNFEPGDQINAYSNSGAMYGSAPTLRAGGPATVLSISASLGTITLTANAPAAWATGDYLVPAGDSQNVIYGLDAYISNVADASVGTLWTMDRTLMRHRLAGVRVGGKGLQIEDAVKRALTECANLGADPSHVFMHPDDFYSLEMANQTKKFGTALNETVGKIGFSGLEFVKPGGTSVRVFPDADCPKGKIYLLKLDDIVLRTAGAFPDFLTLDGTKYDMEPTANAFQGRMGGYGQFVVHNPGLHCVLDMTLAQPT